MAAMRFHVRRCGAKLRAAEPISRRVAEFLRFMIGFVRGFC